MAKSKVQKIFIQKFRFGYTMSVSKLSIFRNLILWIFGLYVANFFGHVGKHDLMRKLRFFSNFITSFTEKQIIKLNKLSISQ